MRLTPNLRVVTLVASLLSAAGCAHDTVRSSAAPSSSPDTFRVMTYNIHHAEGGDKRVDVARVARVITENRADLVAIQEVDVRTKRVAGADEAAELARLTGMHVAFGKAIDYQGGDYGQVILSRYPISEPRTYKLPSKPAKEQRIAVAVTVSPGGGRPDFRFVSTHTDHQADADRVVQTGELLRVLAAGEPVPPTILAGDFNSVPQSAPIRAVRARFTNVSGDRPTVPVEHPRSKIDYVFISDSSPWAAVSSRVLDEVVASDHRAVVVDLRWKP